MANKMPMTVDNKKNKQGITMSLFKKNIVSLSLLMMLFTSLTVQAGSTSPTNVLVKEKINKTTTKNRVLSPSSKAKQSNILSLASEVSQVCAVDENGQNWAKLQRKLTKELTSRSSKNKESTYFPHRNKVSNSATLNHAVSDGNGMAGRYYIPVVFHLYGEQYTCDEAAQSCLTDDKVTDALKRLNEDFIGTNTQDGPIAEQFQAIRDSLNIEFVLAKIAPTGDSTNGIVRYQHEQAGYGSGDSESVNTLIARDAWDNTKYMNVYIMNDLYDDNETNNSGVAWYPDIAMTQANTARVVYNGSYVGSNTDENFRSVLTHEFGHWLNLPHTFESKSCSLANETFCGLTGDRSCDTPQMSLPKDMFENSLNCLGQPTNTENFMHYTNNYAMFTQDQVARMTAALHGDARATLWSNENLIATGLGEYTSNTVHPWDGVSGVDSSPEGEVLASFDNLSAQKNDIDTFVVDSPFGTEAIAFYLSGYSQDPDMYVSAGQAPVLLANGNWQTDHTSFEASGTPEFIGILGPKVDEIYHASVHAFSAYDQANLQILAVEDPLLAEGNRRYHVVKQPGLWSSEGDTPKSYQFSIPQSAEKVVFVLAGTYDGDPDMYISKNRPVDIETADCKPFSAAKLAEYCEFSQGGLFNISIVAFKAYSDAQLHIYYETKDESNQPPFANTSPNYQAVVEHDVHFKADTSTDVDGEITHYFWDFGDGNNSESINPVHVYTQLGEYTASLTVTDNDNAASTTTTKVNITLLNPNDANLCDGCSRVYLTEDIGLSANKASEPRQYKYRVPTAASLVVIEIIAGSSGDPDIHVSQNKPVSIESFDCRPWKGPGELETCQFTQGGIFNVMIDAFEDYSDVTFKAYYDIRDDADHALPNELPIADAGGHYLAISNSPITLTGEGSRDEDGSIVSYFWDLGDGNTSSSMKPIHSYIAPGQYTVKLTVTDNDGATAWATASITVNPIGDMDGDGDIDTHDIRALALAIRRGEALDVSFDFNGDGVINARDLRLMRSLCSYERCSTIAPPPEPPTAVATGMSNVEQFNSTSFSSTGSHDRYGRIISYAWDFGDGSSSSQANPEHAYQEVGQYTVVLTVTDNDGMTATDNVIINVNYGVLANSCLSEDEFSGGTIAASQTICLGEQQLRSFAIPTINNHQSIAITVAYTTGDLALYYRNGGWTNIDAGLYDASSTAEGNKACIYLELNDALEYWSYIQITGATNATLVVDFDTQGCRPIQGSIVNNQ